MKLFPLGEETVIVFQPFKAKFGNSKKTVFIIMYQNLLPCYIMVLKGELVSLTASCYKLGNNGKICRDFQ